MRIVPDKELSDKIRAIGLSKYLAGFDVSESLYNKFLREAAELHPNYDDQRKIRWATYSALCYIKRDEIKHVADASLLPKYKVLFYIQFFVILLILLILILRSI